MLIGVVAVSSVAYAFALVAMKENQIWQQITFLLIYIVGMTFVGEMDVLLSVYFLVSAFPFVIKMVRVSYISIIIYAYFGCYFLFGLLFQNTVETCVSFIGKYWQFIVAFLVFDTKINPKSEATLNQLRVALLVETVLGVYLLLTNPVEDNGMVRLVSNSQPITGNIAIAVLPICVYLFFKNRGNARVETKLVWIELGFLLWIILSGTRGYMIVYAATMLIVFCNYFIYNRRSGKNAAYSRFTIFSFACWMLLVLVILVPGISEKISNILRLEDSGGIREFENAAEWTFFWNAPWIIKLFGIGLGGTPGNYEAYTKAIAEQISKGMWNQNYYLYSAGAPFHNFFANLVLNLGVMGIIAIAAMNFFVWNKTSQICRDKTVKWIFHLYQLSILQMNYVRWPTECGIAEMVLYVLVLKLIESENQKDTEPKVRKRVRRLL